MKTLALLLLALIFNCCQDNKKSGSSKLDMPPNKHTNKAKSTDYELRKWVEYKRETVYDSNDTLPYPNCFITIKRDSFAYYRDNKLLSKQLLISKRRPSGNVYSFSGKPDDLLIFADKRTRCILKRDRFEGEYEYFRLSK